VTPLRPIQYSAREEEEEGREPFLYLTLSPCCARQDENVIRLETASRRHNEAEDSLTVVGTGYRGDVTMNWITVLRGQSY